MYFNTERLQPFEEARDSDFSYALFAQQKFQEYGFKHLPADMVEQLIASQYQVREKAYAQSYEDYRIIMIIAKGKPVGCLRLGRPANQNGIRIVDITIAVEHQNCGYGSDALRQVIHMAKQNRQIVDLHVAKGSSALSLYSRLGFSVCAESELQFHMKLVP